MLNANIIYEHMVYHLVVGNRNIVGTKVSQARKIVNPPITQTDLVARLQLLGMKIDQSGVSKIESGQRPVSDIEVVALARALKLSVTWLLEEPNDLANLLANKTQ